MESIALAILAWFWMRLLTSGNILCYIKVWLIASKSKCKNENITSFLLHGGTQLYITVSHVVGSLTISEAVTVIKVCRFDTFEVGATSSSNLCCFYSLPWIIWFWFHQIFSWCCWLCLFGFCLMSNSWLNLF